MRQASPCDSALEALGWAQHTHTGHPGSRLTLMWIAQTMIGGSQSELDGLVEIEVEKIAEQTDQPVEDVEAAVMIFRALGLVASHWLDNDPRPGWEGSGNRDYLVTSLEAEREDFEKIAERMAMASAQFNNRKGPLG